MIIKSLEEKCEIQGALVTANQFIWEHKDDPHYVEDWLDLHFYSKIFYRAIPNIQTYIARTEEPVCRVIGFIMASQYIKDIAEIRQHYIRAEYRKQGVATQLKKYLTDRLQEQGYKLILSDVAKTNTASIKLNEKLGWTKKELDEETYRFIKRLR